MYRYLKKLLALVVVLLTVSNTLKLQVSVQAEEELRIGVLQFVEHDSLDQTYKGFVDGLAEAGYKEGENLTLNYANASGDMASLQSMSERLTNQSDYLFAIATPAAQAVANVEEVKPIYISAVSDPVEAGLVDSLEEPGRNVTGTVDAGPIKEQIDLLVSIVPEAKKVGLIYNSGEANSVSEAEKAIQELEDRGLEPVVQTVTSTNDISQAMNALVNQDIDVLYTVTDNTIASAMTLVGDLAIEAGLPFVGGSKDMCLENGLATYGLDYYQLGKQTAGMLLKQLEEGTETEDIPLETADVLELVVNEDVAEKLGIDPSSIEAPK